MISVNAEKASGFVSSREIPVLYNKGSFKQINHPTALY
jgi:predicted DNA repair protein MutK